MMPVPLLREGARDVWRLKHRIHGILYVTEWKGKGIDGRGRSYRACLLAYYGTQGRSIILLSFFLFSFLSCFSLGFCSVPCNVFLSVVSLRLIDPSKGPMGVVEGRLVGVLRHNGVLWEIWEICCSLAVLLSPGVTLAATNEE